MATLPLLILTLFSYQRYVQTTYQRMDEISSRLFENAAEEANRVLDSVRNVYGSFNYYYTDGTSLLQDLKKYSDKENTPDSYQYYETYKTIGRTCHSLLLGNGSIYGIYIITPCGYVFDYTNGENGTIPIGYDIEGEYWYQETLQLDGRYYVSSPARHPVFTGKKQSVFISQCLKDVYSHKLMGILLIDCGLEMFDLSSVNTMPDITLVTVDNAETGEALYTNHSGGIPDANSKNVKTSQTMLNLEPLRLSVTVDYDTLFREFSVTGMLLILIGVSCIAGVIIFSFLIANYMVEPISHLSRKMASQKGHTLISSTRYLNRTDEIGILYNEYNNMVESLNLAVKQDYQDKLIILDAQMKSLEARINSHFLFNTLESINSMAELCDNEDIAVMSLALGNMFRYTLKTRSEVVTIEEELNHVKDYVTIQLIRFDHRFTLETDMTEEFRQLKVLKLILQPLVENALYHGLKYCTCGDTIRISGRTSDGCILLDVLDNGQGMAPEELEKLQNSLHEEPSFSELGHRTKQGIGLKNIHSRIELYYGRGYGLTVTTQQGEWTNIQIRLPLIQES